MRRTQPVVWIATELALPERMTQQRDRRSAFARIVQLNASAKDRTDAVGLEEVLGGFRDDQPLWSARLDHQRHEPIYASHASVGDDRSSDRHRRMSAIEGA